MIKGMLDSCQLSHDKRYAQLLSDSPNMIKGMLNSCQLAHDKRYAQFPAFYE